MFAVQGLCFSVLVTRSPELQRAHGMTDTALALMLLAVPVIAGAGSILAGAVMARRGSAFVLRGAQPATCASMLLIGTAQDRLVLYAAAGMFGLFLGAVDASMNAQAVTVEREHGRSLLSGFHAASSAAGIIGGVWIAVADATGLPVATALAVPALLGIALSMTGAFRLCPKDMEARPSGRAVSLTVPWRPIAVIGAAVTCMCVAESAIASFSAKYLEDSLRASGTVAPLAYAAYQVTLTAGRAGAGLLIGARGAAGLLRLGAVVAALGLACAAAAPGVPLTVAGFAAAGLGLAAVVPASYSAAGLLDPSGLGVAVARVNVFTYAGFVLGPVMAGTLVTRLWAAYLLAAALTCTIAASAPAFTHRPAPTA